MNRRRKIILVAVFEVLILVLTFTVYSAQTQPAQFKLSKLTSYEKGYWSSSEIRNRTMNISAFGNEVELGFYGGGDLFPEFYGPDGAHYDPVINLSYYQYSVVMNAYLLTIVELNQSLSFPWTGITFSITDASMSLSDPYLFLSPTQEYSNPPGNQYIVTDMNLGKYIPYNETLNCWLNFTIQPIALLGPYHFAGPEYHVTITWQLEIV